MATPLPGAAQSSVLLTEGGDGEDLAFTEDSGERSTGQPVTSTLSPQLLVVVIPRASVSLAVNILMLPNVKTYNKATVIKAVWE